jgi:MFS family permease
VSGPFRSLRILNYRLWFAGVTISNVGTWMQRTAQDWIVLTELTDHDATAVGLTTALQFGPVLLLSPLTGLAADVIDRRRLLLITQASMGMLSVALGVLYLAGSVELWMVYGFALLLGVVSAFDGPARQAFVSELVPETLLPNAVGLNATSFTVARLAGPAIAGILTAVIGAGWVFVINSGTFAATIAAILTMRVAELLPQPRSPRMPGRIRAGARHVRSHPDLALVVLNALVFSALGMNIPIFVATMATVEFELGAVQFGVLSSVVAIGSIAGAIMGARRERARLSTIALAALCFGFGAVAAALSPNAWVFAACLTVLGFCSLAIMNTTNAYMQTRTPPDLRGRVMAIYIAVVLGGPTLGAPVIGFIATTAGPRWATAAGAIGGFVPALISLLWLARTYHARIGWDRDSRWRVVIRTRPVDLAGEPVLTNPGSGSEQDASAGSPSRS